MVDFAVNHPIEQKLEVENRRDTANYFVTLLEYLSANAYIGLFGTGISYALMAFKTRIANVAYLYEVTTQTDEMLLENASTSSELIIGHFKGDVDKAVAAVEYIYSDPSSSSSITRDKKGLNILFQNLHARNKARASRELINLIMHATALSAITTYWFSLPQQYAALKAVRNTSDVRYHHKPPDAPPPSVKSPTRSSRPRWRSLVPSIIMTDKSDQAALVEDARARIRAMIGDGNILMGTSKFEAVLAGDGRLFILFGDIHVHAYLLKVCEHRSVHVTTVMKREFSDVGGGSGVPDKPKKKIDFFFETQFVDSHAEVNPTSIQPKLHWLDPASSSYTGNAARVEWNFRNCFVPDKTECAKRFPAARFHYVDLRSYPDVREFDSPFSTGIDMIARVARLLIKDLETTRNPFRRFSEIDVAMIQAIGIIIKNIKWYMTEILDTMISGDEREMQLLGASSETVELVMSALMRVFGFLKGRIHPKLVSSIVSRRILKELNSCHVKDEIIDYMRNRIDSIHPESDAVVNRIFARNDVFSSEVPSAVYLIKAGDLIDDEVVNWSMKSVFSLAFLTDVMVMDVYTLARMFKKTIVPSSREVWFFGGYFHSDLYADFLQRHVGGIRIATGIHPRPPPLSFWKRPISSIHKLVSSVFKVGVIPNCLEIDYAPDDY